MDYGLLEYNANFLKVIGYIEYGNKSQLIQLKDCNMFTNVIICKLIRVQFIYKGGIISGMLWYK